MSQEGPPTTSPSHEFSCPADPRWRRIHRGGCWEQDLYPLTAAVTPVAPASLRVAAEGGSGDCKAPAMGWVGRFQRASKVERGASLPYGPHRCSLLSPIDSQGGLLLLRGRYRERGFCGRYRFPGARLLRRGLWP